MHDRYVILVYLWYSNKINNAVSVNFSDNLLFICQEGWIGARREGDDTAFKWVDDSSEVLMQSTEDSFANWYSGHPQNGKHCMSGIYNRDGNHCPSGGFFNPYEPGMFYFFAFLK